MFGPRKADLAAALAQERSFSGGLIEASAKQLELNGRLIAENALVGATVVAQAAVIVACRKAVENGSLSEVADALRGE